MPERERCKVSGVLEHRAREGDINFLMLLELLATSVPLGPRCTRSELASSPQPPSAVGGAGAGEDEYAGVGQAAGRGRGRGARSGRAPRRLDGRIRLRHLDRSCGHQG